MISAPAQPIPRTRLRGIAWDHSRGLLPMLATAQRFREVDAGVAIDWSARSLQAFADQSLEALAREHDLLVIDHPWVGHAAAHGLLMPLDGLCDAAFLADNAANSVGPSHASYAWDGRQWALPIDAAAPVASWRADREDSRHFSPPSTWTEVLDLARRGHVVVAAIPVDALMLTYMLALAHGEEPFSSAERFLSRATAVLALESLRELIALCPRACLQRNPIATYEAMASSDGSPYCPAAFGYSNYARDGYAPNRLRFGEPVRFDGRPLMSTLGGTGLAISAHCRDPGVAARYAQMVAAPRCQRTLYAMSGGQPGHRAAWRDDEVNRWSDGFFARTLPALDRAWLRPRHDGYLRFQDRAGDAVHRYLSRGGSAAAVHEELERIHAESRPRARAHAAEGAP